MRGLEIAVPISPSQSSAYLWTELEHGFDHPAKRHTSQRCISRSAEAECLIAPVWQDPAPGVCQNCSTETIQLVLNGCQM